MATLTLAGAAGMPPGLDESQRMYPAPKGDHP